MQVSVSQREVWDFMKYYADQLADLLKPQNCVPNSMVVGLLDRLTFFVARFDYPTAHKERGPDFYKNREPRSMSVELTQSEVVILMRTAANDLLAGLENAPFRIDTAAPITRLNELQAAMPPYKPTSEEG